MNIETDRQLAAITDLIKVFLVIMVLRIAMLAGGIPIIWIPWIDPILAEIWSWFGGSVVSWVQNPRLPRMGLGL